jgi:hypothetical protein
MWPVLPDADLKQHYTVMDACGLESGRDYWVVALKAAALHNWPVRKLPTVLAGLWPPAPEVQELVSVLSHRLMVSALAPGLVANRDFSDPSFSERDPAGKASLIRTIAAAMVDDSFDAICRVIDGKRTTPDDFRAMAEVVETVVDHADGEDDELSESDEPLSVSIHEEVSQFPARVDSWPDWIATAGPMHLVGAVKQSVSVLDLLLLGSPDVKPSETDRWRIVGALAPLSGAELLPRIGATLTSVMDALERATNASSLPDAAAGHGDYRIGST